VRFIYDYFHFAKVGIFVISSLQKRIFFALKYVKTISLKLAPLKKLLFTYFVFIE